MSLLSDFDRQGFLLPFKSSVLFYVKILMELICNTKVLCL